MVVSVRRPAPAPARFVILLEVRVLIIDVQRRDDPLSYDARPASAAGHSRFAHFARKDQLHGFGSAQIDVLPDDLLEKLPPMPRAIPNLSERKLRLQHREPVAIAGLSVGHRIGVRQRCEPFAEKSLDLLFIETLGDALRRRRVPATQEPVVERFEFDAARGQLLVEILVPLDAELARIGKVGAELDEEGSKVFVHAVKIIVVNHGRGVVDPRDGALAFPEAFAFQLEEDIFMLEFRDVFWQSHGGVWWGICYPPSLENTSRFDGSIRHSSRDAAMLLQPDTTLSQRPKQAHE